VASRFEIRDQTCVVTLAGEFDRANLDTLVREITACLTSAPSVLFDFGAVTYVNGAVMSLLLDVLEGLDEGGWLGVARALPWIEHLLQIAGLTERKNFRIFPSLDEALEAVDLS
jgi:anti-anti-sigma factor